MPKISKINDDTFNVTVTEAVETNHKVHLSDEYHQQLTGGNATKEDLITYSFEFLLARESNAEILKEFDLKVIETYFPTYAKEMKDHFK